MQGRYTQEDNGPGVSSEDDTTEGGKVVVRAHKGLDKVLLKDFSELPKDVDYGDYAVINVSPSVVPAYFPSFRVFTYNVSEEGVQEALERKERRRRGETLKRPPPHGHRKPDRNRSRAKECKKAKYRILGGATFRRIIGIQTPKRHRVRTGC
jgi:hypothetical protein